MISLEISIHAPTRGATLMVAYMLIFNHDFNPRSHKGSDDLPGSFFLLSDDFNPRSHKGSDVNKTNIRYVFDHFNPRSHKGSDHNL